MRSQSFLEARQPTNLPQPGPTSRISASSGGATDQIHRKLASPCVSARQYLRLPNGLVAFGSQVPLRTVDMQLLGWVAVGVHQLSSFMCPGEKASS